MSSDEGVEVGVLRLAPSRRPTRRRGWLADREFGDLIVKIHEQSFGTYGWRRVTAELRLGLGREVNHKRVATADARTRPARCHPPPPLEGLHPLPGDRCALG